MAGEPFARGLFFSLRERPDERIQEYGGSDLFAFPSSRRRPGSRNLVNKQDWIPALRYASVGMTNKSELS
jgi:hypothetical protein